jgi:hypothetical protein
MATELEKIVDLEYSKISYNTNWKDADLTEFFRGYTNDTFKDIYSAIETNSLSLDLDVLILIYLIIL